MTSQHVSQEMIDAHYAYTHLSLDRRAFVKKLRAHAEMETSVRYSFPFEDLAEEPSGTEQSSPVHN